MLSPIDLTATDPVLYTSSLQAYFGKLPPMHPREQTTKSSVPKDISSWTHVFPRKDAVKAPLTPPYTGPYRVLSRTDKLFTLDISGKKETVVTRKVYFYPRTGFYFRTCEGGAGWHLIPYRISPLSEFFSQAYKNGHIMWGINLGLDWPPLARGFKFHTIHTPTRPLSFLPLDNRRYGPRGWDVIIIYCSSRQLRFPVWYF